MFDRVRPVEADAGGTIKGYALTEPGRRPPDKAVLAEGRGCTHCGARVQELRRGRCWGCYQAWAGLRPAGRGARCVVCYERRADALRLVELHGRWLPLCHGCATRTQWLSPVPYTIDALRRVLSRERRGGDRRVGAIDMRPIARERRQVERRADAGGASAGGADTDLGGEVIEVELSDATEIIDITTVLDLDPKPAMASAPAPSRAHDDAPTAPNALSRAPDASAAQPAGAS
jgi:hypothetical protein